MLGIELISDTIGKLNTIYVATSDDNLIPLYVLKRSGTLCWTWVTGDCGETVVVVLPHVCFRAFLVLPCAEALVYGWWSCEDRCGFSCITKDNSETPLVIFLHSSTYPN